jgi:two-component system, OmpR family, sensor histidine kinase KdpD
VLYALSRDISAAQNKDSAALAVARLATEAFDATSYLLLADSTGKLETIAVFPLGSALDSNEVVVAKWAFEHDRAAGLGTDTLPGAAVQCFPLSVANRALGVLALRPRMHSGLHAEQREFLDAFNRQAALAFERMNLSEEARVAAVRAKTEEMRSSLLSAVSHDLRTPLATITGSASTLRDGDGLIDKRTQLELLDTICDEAARLEKLVANLLDMTRLDSGGIEIKRDWVPLEELVGSALTRLEKKLGDRAVQVKLPEELPLVSVDPVLFEQLLENIIDNAIKYTPPESPIEIKAELNHQRLNLEIADRGPGLSPGSESRIFEKFVRGNHTGIGGVGLGLPICKGIAEAHGGSLWAENRPGGGALFHVMLPLVQDAPQVSLSAEGSGDS